MCVFLCYQYSFHHPTSEQPPLMHECLKKNCFLSCKWKVDYVSMLLVTEKEKYFSLCSEIFLALVVFMHPVVKLNIVIALFEWEKTTGPQLSATCL